MRKIRKALSVLLALAMTLSLVPAAFAAEGEAATVAITAPEAGVKAGEAATFTVTLADNPGVSAIGFKLSFVDANGSDVSNQFTTSGNWVTAGPILKDEEGESIGALERNTTNKTIVWSHGANMSTSGILATLKVTPTADVAGTYTAKLALIDNTAENFAGVGNQNKDVEFVDATFTVTVPPLDGASVTVDSTGLTYTGLELDMSGRVTVRATAGGEPLDAQYYSLTYQKKNADGTYGKATSTIKDAGTYKAIAAINTESQSGTAESADFTVAKASLELTGEITVNLPEGSAEITSENVKGVVSGDTVNITYQSSNTKVLTVDGVKLTATKAAKATDTATVTATVVDNDNYKVPTGSIKVNFVDGKVYNINVKQATGGTIKVKPATISFAASDDANKEGSATVTVTPARGYSIATVTYTVGTGEEQVLTAVGGADMTKETTYTLTLEKGDGQGAVNVTVTATYTQAKYTVAQNTGAYTTEPKEAGYGEEIVVTPVKPESPHVVLGVEYATGTGEKTFNPATKNKNGTYSFKMPNENVTEIKVTVSKTAKFDTKDGSAVASVEETASGYVVLPAAPTKADNVFKGWQAGDNTYKAGETVKYAETFTAVWVAAPTAEDTAAVATITEVEVDTKAVAGDTEASIAADAQIPSSEVANVLEAAAGTQMTLDGSAKTSDYVKDTAITNAGKADTAKSELLNQGVLKTNDEGQPVFKNESGEDVVATGIEIKTEIYIEVEAKSFVTETDGKKTYEVDIQPMAKVTATPTGEGGAKGEAVELADKKVTLKQAVTVTLPLPFTPESMDNVKLTHKPGTVDAKQIKYAAGNDNKSISFESKDFSPYAVSEATQATVGDTAYADAQAAVNAAAGTKNVVTIVSDDVTEVTVPKGKTVSIVNEKPDQTAVATNGKPNTVVYGAAATSVKAGGSRNIDIDDIITPTPGGGSGAGGGQTTPVNPTPSTGFIDVPANAYYADAVKWAVEQGITNGKNAADTFKPNDVCTRAEAVTFLYRAAGSPDVAASSQFKDVVSGSWYEKAVAWAVANGITNGKDAADTFCPNDTCTRAEIVTFLARFEKAAAVSNSQFTDVPANEWYAGSVGWAVAQGITNGKDSATTFKPADSCTRAEIVTFLYRDFVK